MSAATGLRDATGKEMVGMFRKYSGGAIGAAGATALGAITGGSPAVGGAAGALGGFILGESEKNRR